MAGSLERSFDHILTEYRTRIKFIREELQLVIELVKQALYDNDFLDMQHQLALRLQRRKVTRKIVEV